MQLLFVVSTVFVIPVHPSTVPTEVDRILEPWSLTQIEDEKFLLQYLRDHTTPHDLQHLPLTLFLTQGVGEKVRAAREATNGEYGVILPIPPQVWVPVTSITRIFSHFPCYFSVGTAQQLANVLSTNSRM